MINYSTHHDSVFVYLFRSGDDYAFKEIYNRYNQLLFIFAVKKLESESEAMDVVQDVFVWVLNNRDKLILKTALSSYLYKSTLNRIFDLFRRHKTFRKYIDEGNHFIDVDHVGSDYLIREKEIKAIIAKQIAAMPPRMREVYTLKHQQNLNQAQIAELLGISEHTVNVHLQRSFKHLKDKLGVFIFVLFILHP